MTNPMPTFKVFKNRVFVGMVSAVSEAQAHARAYGRYGRCEVMLAADSVSMPAGGRRKVSDASYTHGRSPYAVGDFEARRKAEIAAWMARQD